MTLKISTFKTRALTALVFVAIMLLGLLWNQWSFFLLFSFIHFGCWVEYQRLLEKISPEYKEISSFHRYGIMIAGWCLMLYFTNDNFLFITVRLHALGWWIGLLFLFTLPITELLFSRNIHLKNIGYSAFGILYISLSWGLFMGLYSTMMVINERDLDEAFSGRQPLTISKSFLPLVIIASLWINDTMAYIVGSLIGKTPLTTISPKKTWEGTLGGALLAIVVVSVAMHFISGERVWWFWTGIATISAVAGTFGDIFESKLKRMALVKDSGNIMPGHGGFLDRFDSLLFAIPFVWVFVQIVSPFLV